MQAPDDSTNFVLTYPNALALNMPVFLGYSLGDFSTRKRAGDQLEVVDSFKLFVLHYMVSEEGRETVIL